MQGNAEAGETPALGLLGILRFENGVEEDA
jgi:hypothetical protein